MSAVSSMPVSPRDTVPASGIRLAGRQTLALFIDALRRLRAAKLFWVALALSFLVAALCGFVGINERGLTFPFIGEWENPVWNSNVLPPGEFYKFIFTSFGVAIWLTYAANLLALISTASLVPALVEDGSVDLYVTRPLGRVRLFLTRYVTGLLFVALQTLCFSVAAMGVFAIRAGVFLPGLLWAVVFVTMFFSFLYCVSALVGLLTGSGVTAILLTLLFWMFVWALDWAEFAMLMGREQTETMVEVRQAQLERARQVNTIMANAGVVSQDTAAQNLTQAEAEALSAQSSQETVEMIHRVLMGIKAPLPKTGETITLLSERLSDATDLEQFDQERKAHERADLEERADWLVREGRIEAHERDQFIERNLAEAEGVEEGVDAYANRPLLWTLGTSFAFEGVLVLLCCWSFARRDLS